MSKLFDAVDYLLTVSALAPHGICLLWRPELIWTHVVSDSVIGIAYFSIPLALWVFVRRRPDVKFSWAVWMFIAFILLCGLTHFIAIVTIWTPIYGIEAIVKAATAVVSLATAAALWPLLPKALALPSTAELEARIAERDAALENLKAAMDTMVEMREHERRQKLLLDELNHRVKNSLTSVQSVAEQTFRNAGDPAEVKDLFIDRLLALSATHNLLVKQEWRSASFRELVESHLGHYGRPYEYDGPDFVLPPNFAVSTGMALHELATNALKYGAWSGDGRVVLTVAETEDEICWRWQEVGGPPTAAPKRRGFGSRLLAKGLPAELRAKATLSYEAEGFAYDLCMQPAGL